ncbi:MAG: hypothetical protein R3C53_19995 [Pirellulaceae bacterium]
MTMKEMGDEGRVPPPLTGAGDKLKSEYIEKILNDGVDERNYMHVNMPGFGLSNLDGLVDRMVRLDQQTAVDLQPLNEPASRVESDGRLLVGEKGLSCVKCHTFGGKGAPGIGAIDLQRMTTRLREDWFHRYLMSPTTYRPGTRMPASFPEGKSVLPDLYGGQPSQQIAAMWTYLSAGNKAREPIGVGQQLIELVPGARPTIYRNFIEGLTPRGIAVGYPEQGHIAWDANRLCLTLLWKGAFIDASKHWVGRGPGNQVPLGDELLTFERAAPFAVLDSADSPWPDQAARELGNKFLGYRLNARGQPTFRYRIGQVEIEDTPVPAIQDGKLVGFDRTLSVKAADNDFDHFYFRAARGDKIEAMADGWFKIDEHYSLHTNVPLEVIEVAGHSELRIPVAKSITFTQRIRW